MKGKKEIIGTFIRQQWVNDYAVEIERRQFRATEHILKMPLEALHEMKDNDESSDAIGMAHVSHEGPHEVELEEAIKEFFGVEKLGDITQEMRMRHGLIFDGQDLKAVHHTRWGEPKPVDHYDDGFGPLWVYRNSSEMLVVVRAQKLEEAWAIIEDEFMPACDLTHEELVKEFATEYMSGRELWLHQQADKEVAWEYWNTLGPEDRDKIFSMPGMEVPFGKDYSEHPCFQEQYGFRPSGARREKDGSLSHIYCKDMRGESLERLTLEGIKHLELVLTIETED